MLATTRWPLLLSKRSSGPPQKCCACTCAGRRHRAYRHTRPPRCSNSRHVAHRSITSPPYSRGRTPRRPDAWGAVTLVVAASGQRLEAQLEEDAQGNLCLNQLSRTTGATLVCWGLATVLNLGWRIVWASPAEQAQLNAHGFGRGWVQ